MDTTIQKAYCNNCQNKTDHTVIFQKSIKGFDPIDDEFTISWLNKYKLLECNGCHEVQLENEFFFSEWNEGESEITIFPPRISRKTPIWIDDIPKDQKELLEELYISLATNSKRLVVMGARTLIDMFINHQIGDIGTFAQKLDELEKRGLVSIEQKKYLTAALDTGNAVIHRGFNPSDDIVNKVLDIIENLLINYSLKKKKVTLAKVTPKRKKTKSKNVRP